MNIHSTLRITFDPGGGNELVVLDWGDRMERLPELPWRQAVDRPGYIEATHAGVRARGKVDRTIAVSRRVEYADHEAALAGMLDNDAALPSNITAALHVRTLDLSASPSGTEEERTAAHYIAATAAIESCEAMASDKLRTAIEYRYRIAVGQLVFQTPA